MTFILLRFTSLGSDGSASFKVVVEATQPQCAVGGDVAADFTGCPDGPCCQGAGCCTVALSTDASITSPSYPADSGRNLSCAWNLVAPAGYNVALNFLDMDMRQDSGESCDNDFVKIADPLNSAHGALGPQGLSFCGELVPNFPAPSVFSSSGNAMVIEYQTDISNVVRGRGFSAVASAVNPLCTSISYSHVYDDNVCEATCSPHVFPTPPPAPHCYPVELTAYVVEANTTIPISGASIEIETLSNGVELADNPYWVAPEQLRVTRLTNLDGTALQDVTETGTYLLRVIADGYFPHTVEVNITCDDVEYCGDCHPEAVIELEPVPVVPCEDITLTVTVTDEETTEPIPGATISITYENNNETFFTVENGLTDMFGTIDIEMTPVAEYTIYISKEPYFSVNQTVDAMCDNQNCSACIDLSLDVPLERPTCPLVNMTIHVRHNYTDEPVPDATIIIINVETGEPVTNETLVTDETGEVIAPIPMDAEYEVVVIHEDFINQEHLEPVDCDELHCELCAPVVSFEISPNPDPPLCIEEGGFIIVGATDDYTLDPIRLARVTYTLLANDNTRLEDQVLGREIPTNANGTTKLRVPVSGIYEVELTHANYETVEVQTVNVTCSEDNSTECSCEWPLDLTLTQDFCEESYLDVVIKDSLTNQAIEGAIVNVTLVSSVTSFNIIENEETDAFGAIQAELEGNAQYQIFVEKDGFVSTADDTFIYCEPDSCDGCSQVLSLTMDPINHCEENMFVEITVTDSITTNPIENVTVTLTLINFANGPSDENVGGELLTDENGQIQPELFVDGDYTITLTAEDHMSVESGFTINSFESCENPVIPLQMIPHNPPVCTPTLNVTVRDNTTLLPIPLASLNLTLHLGEEIAGTSDALVGENLLTDEDGMVFYLVGAYGNMTAAVSAEGFYSNTGSVEVICDGYNCAACELVLVVELEEIQCPVSEVVITVTDELTQEPIPDAEVTYTLTSTPETGETFITFPPNTTNEEGIVTFPLIHMGNYTITVEVDGYDPVEVPTDLECNPEHCEACLPMYEVELRREYCEDVSMALWVANGVTNGPLTGAVVDIVVIGYEGVLVPAGQVIVDAEGWARIPIIGDGTYRYTITYPGFAPTVEEQIINLQAMMTGEDPNCDLFGLVMMGARPVFPPLECGDVETEGVRVSLAWAEEPADLDLYSFRVSMDDPEDTCLAYYCDQKELCGCMEFSNDVQTGGLNGTEAISYCCNDPEAYMIYVDDASTRGVTIKDSEARIVLTQTSGTSTVIQIDPETAPSGSDARYWVAGCMKIVETVPEFISVNRFFAEDPTVIDPQLCYNLFTVADPQEVPLIPTTVTVNNGVTGLPISGAVVKINAPLADGRPARVYEVSSVDGVARTNLEEAGVYEVIVQADGFIPDRDQLDVACLNDGLMTCVASITITLMPETTGTIQLDLNWDGITGPTDLDFFAYQVSKTDSSTTCNGYYGNSACNGVTVGEDSTDGQTAGESIALTDIQTNSGVTYMLYGKNNGDNSLYLSHARITISDGRETQTVELDETQADATPGAKYWLAGCLQIVGSSFTLTPVNRFYLENLAGEPNNLYCDNLIQNNPAVPSTPEPFCDNASIQVIVSDAKSFAPVAALVSASLVVDETISVLAEELPATNDGSVLVSINSNGRYELEVSADGYITDSDEIVISCNINDCSSCSHVVYVSLSPVVPAGLVRVMLGWGEMPNNWDLKSLQVEIEDPTSTCITSSAASCSGTEGPDDQNVSNGAETLDVSGTSATYLVYVKNSCGVPYSTVSAAHITITDAYETKKTHLPVEYYNHESFWIIGCLRIGSQGYVYREINQFGSEDPAENGNPMRMYCQNTLGQEDIEPTTTPSPPVPSYVTVNVRDPSTNAPVNGAEVTLTTTSETYNYTVQGTSSLAGVAVLPVYANGYFEVIIDEPTHFETRQGFFVDCYGEPICDPSVEFSLVPAITEAGDVRIIAEWRTAVPNIDMQIFELSAVGEQCQTTNDSPCSSVTAESPTGTEGSESILIPGTPSNDGTSFMIYLGNEEDTGRNFLYSDASIVVADSDSLTRVNIPVTHMSYQSLREALLFGGWRTVSEVTDMSEEDQRNTLIVELEKITSYTVAQIQALPTTGSLNSLVGVAAIAVFLESRRIRSIAELNTMTYEEERNTLIYDLQVHGGYEVAFLQALGDFDLVVQGFETSFYNRRQIRSASNGQSYWIVGCMNVVNGIKRFELVNTFVNQLPGEIDRLLCHDLLDLPAPATRGPPSFWDGKSLQVSTRNAIDNTASEVCIDVSFTSQDEGETITRIILEDACSENGANIIVPLSETGSGLYSIEFNAAGFVGFSEELELTESSCGNGPDCMFYTTMSPTPAAGITRTMMTWDDSVEGVDFSMYQVNRNIPIWEPGCLLNGTSGVSCGQSSVTRNVVNLQDGSLGGTAYSAAGSQDYSYMLFTNIPDQSISLAIMSSASLEQAILFGAWRTQSQLLEMSGEGMRNTLIVEMERISSLSISELQALSSSGNLGSLVGFSSISVFLLTRNIRTSAQLSSMDYDDQRNTLITDFVNNLGQTTRDLQALGDFDLTSVGFASNFYAGNTGSGSSELRVMITDGQSSVEERYNTAEIADNARFVVIGCLKSYAGSYQYVSVNLFTTENPLTENSRYCHNLFMDAAARTFPENVFIETILRNSFDNSPVMNAIVQVSSSGNSESSSAVTDGSGIARIPVYDNGTYLVLVNGDQYEMSYDFVDVSCANSDCDNRVLVNVVPVLDADSMMVTLKWSQNVGHMALRAIKVDAASSDEHCITGPINPDFCGDVQLVHDGVNRRSPRGNGGLDGGSALRITNLGSSEVVSYQIIGTKKRNSASPSSIRAAQVSAQSLVTVTGHQSLKKISINKKYEIENSLRGALLYGEWTSISEIFTASEEEQRNTLIVQLEAWSSLEIAELQAMSNTQLINFGAVSGFLKVFEIHQQSALSQMNINDQTNSLINALSHHNGILSQYRVLNANHYYGPADLAASMGTMSAWDLVGRYSSRFNKPNVQAKVYWIAGCIKAQGGNTTWVPVGEFVSEQDYFFCHNLVYSNLPEPTTTQAPFYDNVGIHVIARSSQNNNAVTGAKGSVNIQSNDGLTSVVEDAQFDASGELFVPVSANGVYAVQVKAEGFITADFEIVIACTADNCQSQKLVTLSPVMPPGQTRLMVTWETANPTDVDTHVMAVRKSDSQTCKTYYGNRNGCASVSQDLDNTHGGLNGAETVTLTDNAINSDYRYLVGIHDYRFQDNGVPFLNSGSSLTVTNGIQTVTKRMEGSGPITRTNG